LVKWEQEFKSVRRKAADYSAAFFTLPAMTAFPNKADEIYE
jgi:hypothetical protein